MRTVPYPEGKENKHMPNSRGPSRRITLTQIRGVLHGLQETGELPATPRDIAETLEKETTPKTVRKRLEELRKNEEVTKHKSGPGFVWDLSSDEADADIDLTNKIAGVLESAELEDIPTDQAGWIAESLPAEEFSDKKKMEIVETIDSGLLSDEKLKEFIESTNPKLISEGKIWEIIESAELEVEDFPDEIAEEIVSERYGYSQTYWANSIRGGRNMLAGSAVTVALVISVLLIPFRFGPYDLPAVAGVSLPDFVIESQTVVLILFFVSMAFFFTGFVNILVGSFGRRYSSVDDPRPWSDFIKRILRKLVNLG